MIKEFVDPFMSQKEFLLDFYTKFPPKTYLDLVTAAIDAIGARSRFPNAEAVHEIDDGDYQGTLVYLIAERIYQPTRYWCVRVSYGSCSACDTLQSIQDSEGAPEEKAKQYWTLALHVVQNLKEIDGGVVQ